MKRVCILLCSAMLLHACQKPMMEDPKPKDASNFKNGGDSTAPGFSGDGVYDVLGWSYDITGEFADPESVRFQVVDPVAFNNDPAQAGRLVVDYMNSEDFYENYASDALEWSKKRSSSLDVTANIPLFGTKLSAGFTSSYTTNTTFNGMYQFASYDMVVKLKRIRFNSDAVTLRNYLTPSFIADVNTYGSNPQQLVQRYGTHVCNKFYVGQRLDLTFRSESTSENRELAAAAGIKLGVGIFNLSGNTSINTSYDVSNKNRFMRYKTRGGSGSYSLVGTLSLDQQNSPISITGWRNSLNASNAVLVDIDKTEGLLPLYDFISDPTIRANVKAYIDQYMLDNQLRIEYLTSPVHRFWHNGRGIKDHYFSLNTTTPGGYDYEGVGFEAFAYRAPGTVPIYSHYHSGIYDHFYMKSNVSPGGYNYEGIAWFAYPNAVSGTVPIHRFYSPGNTDHHLDKISYLGGGYNYEGIEFYAK